MLIYQQFAGRRFTECRYSVNSELTKPTKAPSAPLLSVLSVPTPGHIAEKTALGSRTEYPDVSYMMSGYFLNSPPIRDNAAIGDNTCQPQKPVTNGKTVTNGGAE